MTRFLSSKWLVSFAMRCESLREAMSFFVNFASHRQQDREVIVAEIDSNRIDQRQLQEEQRGLESCLLIDEFFASVNRFWRCHHPTAPRVSLDDTILIQ
jgi:hypothetical protein